MTSISVSLYDLVAVLFESYLIIAIITLPSSADTVAWSRPFPRTFLNILSAPTDALDQSCPFLQTLLIIVPAPAEN